MAELSEQELLRRDALKQLNEMGIDAYPAALYPVTTCSEEILKEFNNNPDKFKEVSIAGRIMSRRIMGAASFVA
jgi:lysyl-tRNA synthetase class 2